MGIKKIKNIFTEDTQEQIEEITEPIDPEIMDDILNLIKVAHKVNCVFDLIFQLEIGEFHVDSASFNDIKLLKKTKNEDERVILSYNNLLLSHDTTINLKDIVKVTFILKYCSDDKGSEVNV